MHILILTSSYPAIYQEAFEGSFVEAFAEALSQSGHRVYVVTQCTGAPTYVDAPGIVVRRFPWCGKGTPLSILSLGQDAGKVCSYFLRGWQALRRLVTSVPIDVTICAWTLPTGLFGWYLQQGYGIPYVTWSLGSDIWKYDHQSLSRRLLQLILRQSLKNYADGYQLIEQIQALVPAGASFLSTTRVLPPADHSQVQLREGKRNVLFVGRYHPNKGPDVLLEAIRLLGSQTRQGTFFHFFGLGQLQAELQTKVDAYSLADCVAINGPMTAPVLAAYLERVAYLVIPSRIESIPVILSDALQKRCPIIATNVGDMGKLLAEYQAGYVAASADPRELAMTLEQAFSERTLQQVGMAALYRLFDVHANAARVVHDIHSLSPPPPVSLGPQLSRSVRYSGKRENTT
jgi:glycosyltransferase involved in cell wall biosynthesis